MELEKIIAYKLNNGVKTISVNNKKYIFKNHAIEDVRKYHLFLYFLVFYLTIADIGDVVIRPN